MIKLFHRQEMLHLGYLLPAEKLDWLFTNIRLTSVHLACSAFWPPLHRWAQLHWHSWWSLVKTWQLGCICSQGGSPLCCSHSSSTPLVAVGCCLLQALLSPIQYKDGKITLHDLLTVMIFTHFNKKNLGVLLMQNTYYEISELYSSLIVSPKFILLI